MRNVVLMMHVSLDGFVARSDGGLDWIFGDMNEELGRWTVDLLKPMDTQVMGRVAYEEQSQHWPTATDELAPVVNGATKVVFSSTLRDLDWENSRLATRDLATEIAELKAQEGSDIFVPGGARIAQSLSAAGLVDVYHLVIHPVALGTGMPLFSAPASLRLQSVRQFDTGAVAMTFTRA